MWVRKRESPAYLLLVLAIACTGLVYLQCSLPESRDYQQSADIDFHSVSVNATQNHSALSQHTTVKLPAGFALIPSAEERPLKQKAVITLLLSSDTKEGSMDFYSIGAILHTFLFNHYPATKFTKAEASDTEFAVMVTPMIPSTVRDALLDVGARLIVVPVLVLQDWDSVFPHFQYVMTKLRVFQLEAVYSSILFVDADVFYLHTNPVSGLWKYLEAHEANPDTRDTPFFGASPDPCKPTINSGMFLVRPSIAHFNDMVRLAVTPPYNEYVDQTAIHFYYANMTGMTHFPEIYNHFPYAYCKRKDMNTTAVGYHHKFWNHVWVDAPLFSLWQRPMAALRQWQVSRNLSTALVPVVPKNRTEWLQISDSGVMMHRVALFSIELGRGKEIELRRRDEFAGLHAQAVHVRQGDIPKESPRSSVAFLEALRFAGSHLLVNYDWVFILDHRAVVVRNAHMHAHLGTIAKLTEALGVYRDCSDTAVAGFWIGRKALAQIKQIVADLDRIWDDQSVGAYSSKLTDDNVWEFVAQAFAESMVQLPNLQRKLE
ncbi:hypothetical protein BC830DRAFT_30808 [Chytriomyces sp. MP71]|nr:hypothetical protein BC830DRAFT_30808 [Chytriomyces sp. MP71]